MGVATLETVLKSHGFDHYGFARLERPVSLDFYREWLERGFHGGMHYLAENEPLKEDAHRWAPQAQSAIVLTCPYVPHPFHEPVPELRIALYAQGEDYHLRLKAELEALAEEFRRHFPSEEFLCFTDSVPLLERDLAAKAGLGWIGKNSCLLHKDKGSLFFIAQILTSMKLESPRKPLPDMCGTCDRCIRACPTQALESPRWLDARKCISYLTIEDRDLEPKAIHAQMGDWFFGCDICQTVCPWNEKVFGREEMRALTLPSASKDRSRQIEDLREILRASGKQLEKRFRRSPLLRARPSGLKRNALLVIGNLKIRELKSEVEVILANEKLKPIAQWTLAQLA